MTIRELVYGIPHPIVQLEISSEASRKAFIVTRDDFDVWYDFPVKHFVFENLKLKITLAIPAAQLWVYHLLENLSLRANVKVVRGGNLDIIRKEDLLVGLKVLPSGLVNKIIYSEPGDYIILVYKE